MELDLLMVDIKRHLPTLSIGYQLFEKLMILLPSTRS